jgi:WS/DGAT/MGAT family acyltransferase
MRSSPRRFNDADAVYLPWERAVGSEMAPLSVSVLEGPLSSEAKAHQRELQARLVPNHRRRIVVDPFSPALPRWVDVPGFDPDDAWLELPAPGGGTLRDVLDWTARWALLPLPKDRPPWRAVEFDGVTVDGVAGRTVIVQQGSHCILDASGALRMYEHYFRFGPEEPLAPLPARPSIEELTPGERWREGWAIELGRAAGLARRTGRRLRWATHDPRAAVDRARDLIAAGQRLHDATGPTPCSPLLRRQGPGLRFDEMVLDLAALKVGARAAGGSINDGLMAAVALGLRRWHRDHGVEVPSVRLGLAIDTRPEGTTWEGNDVLAVVLALPTDDDDPAGLVQRCRSLSREARGDADALRALEVFRAFANRLPLAVAGPLARYGLKGIDLSLSNSVGIPRRRWVGGVEQLRDIGLVIGTFSALCVTLYSRGAEADVALTTCPVAVPDPERLLARIAEAFEAVSALAAS